ncbi:MAG: IS3 family transposase [Bacteroidota bacterium]
MKYAQRFPVEKMCRLLKISTSSYYYWLKKPEPNRQIENRKLLQAIAAIAQMSRHTYGSPRIWAELRAQGYNVSKRRVARLMKENGIYAATKRKFKVTTNSKHTYSIALNLLKQRFMTSRKAQVWVSDIMEFPLFLGQI